MACRGESRAEKDEISARSARAFKLHPIVRRGGEQAGTPAYQGTVATADMQPSAQRGSQAWVAGNHQGEPARPAKTGEVVAKRLPFRSMVMAEDNAGEALRQTGYRGPRIRQAGFVRKEPERWEGGPLQGGGIASLDRARPSDELAIHVR